MLRIVYQKDKERMVIQNGVLERICLLFELNNNIIIKIVFIETIRLTNRNRLQCTVMQLKQFTRTQMTEDINLNYKQYRQPAIHGANSSLQSMAALRGANSLPLTLYARCYLKRHVVIYTYIHTFDQN